MIFLISGSINRSKLSQNPLQKVVDVIYSWVVQQIEREGNLQDSCKTMTESHVLKDDSATNTNRDNQAFVVVSLAMLVDLQDVKVGRLTNILQLVLAFNEEHLLRIIFPVLTSLFLQFFTINFIQFYTTL